MGFQLAFNVSRVLTERGVFLSLKTCNFRLSSLVKAGEVQRSCEAFGIMCQRVQPDFYLFGTAINSIFKGGRVKDAIGCFWEWRS